MFSFEVLWKSQIGIQEVEDLDSHHSGEVLGHRPDRHLQIQRSVVHDHGGCSHRQVLGDQAFEGRSRYQEAWGLQGLCSTQLHDLGVFSWTYSQATSSGQSSSQSHTSMPWTFFTRMGVDAASFSGQCESSQAIGGAEAKETGSCKINHERELGNGSAARALPNNPVNDGYSDVPAALRNIESEGPGAMTLPHPPVKKRRRSGSDLREGTSSCLDQPLMRKPIWI